MTRLQCMIDEYKTATSPYCEEIPDNTALCANCGNLIGCNDTYYSIGGWEYCEECEGKARGVLDDFISDLLGRHVSEEALDAIMEDCEKTW